MKRFVIALPTLIVVVVGGCYSVGLLAGVPSMVRRQRFDWLVRNADHTAIARAALAVISQAKTTHVYSDTHKNALTLSLTNLPPIISKMHPTYVVVEPDRMRIEFIRGFDLDNRGFVVQKTGEEWVLSWYERASNNRILGIPITEADAANKGVVGTSLRAAPNR